MLGQIDDHGCVCHHHPLPLVEVHLPLPVAEFHLSLTAGHVPHLAVEAKSPADRLSVDAEAGKPPAAATFAIAVAFLLTQPLPEVVRFVAAAVVAAVAVADGMKT